MLQKSKILRGQWMQSSDWRYIDIEDPEENPFHEDLTSLKTIMAGMVKRTREAQDQGDAYAPLTLILVDDLMSGSGPSQGYRYNDDILKLFSTSRHSGGVCLLLTQSQILAAVQRELAESCRYQVIVPLCP